MIFSHHPGSIVGSDRFAVWLRQPPLPSVETACIAGFMPIQAGGWSTSTLPRTIDWSFEYNKALVRMALRKAETSLLAGCRG
ncbi:hypothetical protein [Nostoc sp. DedSLP04]|uniref:hypothetical protein n=1 Tax=Nostoc sp. DedSLP04 TaxID=3075401 RepID=UPI002AD2D8C6|nr:hypothetical protein [Nostoc sp. DedSLP04]MDZ8034775.1 hypothetical protein [Nostoc sp. DedSLP04]